MYELKHGNLTAVCRNLMSEMQQEIGGYYGYNLYDTCVGKQVFPLSYYMVPAKRSWWGPPRFNLPSSRYRSSQHLLGGAVNDYPCPGPAMMMWLNRSDVRVALDVDVDSYFFSTDGGSSFNYSLTEKTVLPFYANVIRNNTLRVLVYNGDTDPGINSFITQDLYFNYFKQVGIQKTAKWRPWTTDGKKQMGGYVTKFASNFAYLTIRGRYESLLCFCLCPVKWAY